MVGSVGKALDGEIAILWIISFISDGLLTFSLDFMF